MVKPCVLTGVVVAACVVGSRSFTGSSILMRGTATRPAQASSRNSWVTPRMSTTEEPKVSSPTKPEPPAPAPAKAEMVVVNTENTEFSAGVLGGIAGFFVGGPFLAAVLAIAANYGSKQDNDAGEAVRAVGKSAIEAFNFLTTINSKYDVTGKAASSLDEAVSKLKEQGGSAETIEQVEKTVKDITSQAGKLSSEYDLPAKAKQALGVAGELADTAIVKGIELEKEYNVTEKVTSSIKKQIEGPK